MIWIKFCHVMTGTAARSCSQASSYYVILNTRNKKKKTLEKLVAIRQKNIINKWKLITITSNLQ